MMRAIAPASVGGLSPHAMLRGCRNVMSEKMRVSLMRSEMAIFRNLQKTASKIRRFLRSNNPKKTSDSVLSFWGPKTGTIFNIPSKVYPYFRILVRCFTKYI